MTFKQYQKRALTTATYGSVKKAIICSALGLMGEFTEFTENPIPHEMGDVWWYFAVLSYHLDIQPTYNKNGKVSKVKAPALIGNIQEIIKKSYRDNDLNYFKPEKRLVLEDLFNDLYTCLYFWSMTVISDTVAENCAEMIWHLNLLKLKDRKERNVLHGSGDER